MESNLDKNLTKEQEAKVCAKEMKEVRLAAFRNELLYHMINTRFYMDMLNIKKGEAPFWASIYLRL